MTPELIITLSVTCSVTCLLLGVYYFWFAGESSTADDRLMEVVKRDHRHMDAHVERRTGLLDILVPRLSQSIRPRTGLEQQHLRLRLARAGFNGNYATELFLALKMSCLIGGAFGGSLVGLAPWGFHQPVLVCAVIGGCLSFYLPDLVLRSLTVKRQEEILLALPNAIDLLIVAIEVGQGLDAAIKRITKEMTRSSYALSQEFAYYNLQLQMGKPRSEALHELGLRSGVPDMNSFATVLIQADRFGASIAKTMRQLSETARRKRRQRAEERAQKTAVKLIFPLVLFIFPGVFVVLVGPAMLLLWRDLGSLN